MARNPPLLDSLSRVPAYIQVASAIRRRIETGQWKPQEKISTLDELEAEFNVSRVTVSKAIELLEEEKLVKRQQGKGTFVSANSTEKRWLTLESSWAGMARAIERNVPQFIPTADPPALPTLEPDEAQLTPEYVFLRSVQKKEGVPYALVSVHVARDLYDRHRDDFMKRTALSVLADMQDLRIQKAYQTLEVQTTEKDVANLLRISLSAPTVACRCVVINDQGEAIYVANITYRGDCVKLSMNLLPA
jgi:GntR family transcriptional regulator